MRSNIWFDPAPEVMARDMVSIRDAEDLSVAYNFEDFFSPKHYGYIWFHVYICV